MKKAFAAVAALLIAVAATPVSAQTIYSGGIVTITRTQQAPAQCKYIGQQLFPNAMWVTVYVNGECQVSIDPPDPMYD